MFAQIKPGGSRLTQLARSANMTPKAVGELVVELEETDYLIRRPDPGDRRAKLIVLTDKGHACVAAGMATIEGLEAKVTEILGERGHRQPRLVLQKLLDSA